MPEKSGEGVWMDSAQFRVQNSYAVHNAAAISGAEARVPLHDYGAAIAVASCAPAKAAEKAAARHVKVQRLMQDIEGDLRRIKWPWCRTRPNVTPEDQAAVKAFPLGLVIDRAKGPTVSQLTEEHSDLVQKFTLLMKLARPDFKFTTIQLNAEFDCELHVDGNNAGPSALVALGNFRGGKLWHFEPDKGTVPATVTRVMRGWPRHHPGEVIWGHTRDVTRSFLYFDGNCPHMVTPSTGVRFSIVYFCSKQWAVIAPPLRQKLEADADLPQGSLPAAQTRHETCVVASWGGNKLIT